VMMAVYSVMGYNDSAQAISYLLLIFVVGIPSITAFVRRMHDIGRSGWWYWIGLVPIIGSLVQLYFCVQPSDGPNEYGETNAG